MCFVICGYVLSYVDNRMLLVVCTKKLMHLQKMIKMRVMQMMRMKKQNTRKIMTMQMIPNLAIRSWMETKLHTNHQSLERNLQLVYSLLMYVCACVRVCLPLLTYQIYSSLWSKNMLYILKCLVALLMKIIKFIVLWWSGHCSFICLTCVVVYLILS